MQSNEKRQDLVLVTTYPTIPKEIQRYLDQAGRVIVWPAKRSTRQHIFAYLASLFQPERAYSEREVNELLARHLACHDYATVRRDLCDFRYLKRERDGSCYRRAADTRSEQQSASLKEAKVSSSEENELACTYKKEMDTQDNMHSGKSSLTTEALTEGVLAEYFGGPVSLGEGRDLGGSARSKVWRFPVLAGPTAAPASVIVKRANAEAFEPDAPDDAAWMLFNDWASLQFLSTLETPAPLAPTFYGGVRETGLFVMEDLGEGTRLDHLLLGNDANAAEAGLLNYATVHGRLHALTIRRQKEYLRLREALGPARPPSIYALYDWFFSALQSMTKQLGVSLQPGVEAELGELEATLSNPGPFHTFVQSDAAPDNCLWRGKQLMLLDFEGARYAHALLEGVYCRMPFPTCWCVYRIPEVIMQRAENAYRNELARACPAAADDTLFYRAVVEACIYWALSFHTWLRPLEKMLAQDRHLVALTDRQRSLLYVQAAARASEEFEHLRATGTTLRAIASELATRWPEAVEPPYYPAFS